VRRWLAAVLFVATGLQAQTLDLRVRPVTEGSVTAIREIHAAGKSTDPLAPQSVGLPSDLDQGPLVGAVATRSFGRQPGERKWQFGAAGTPEMQARLAQNAYEVVVRMDDGEQRIFRPRDGARFGIGQRVTVRSGELEPT
jgi:hypothetical protein